MFVLKNIAMEFYSRNFFLQLWYQQMEALIVKRVALKQQ